VRPVDDRLHPSWTSAGTSRATRCCCPLVSSRRTSCRVRSGAPRPGHRWPGGQQHDGDVGRRGLCLWQRRAHSRPGGLRHPGSAAGGPSCGECVTGKRPPADNIRLVPGENVAYCVPHTISTDREHTVYLRVRRRWSGAACASVRCTNASCATSSRRDDHPQGAARNSAEVPWRQSRGARPARDGSQVPKTWMTRSSPRCGTFGSVSTKAHDPFPLPLHWLSLGCRLEVEAEDGRLSRCALQLQTRKEYAEQEHTDRGGW